MIWLNIGLPWKITKIRNHLRFGFTPKTGIAFPKTAVLFLLCVFLRHDENRQRTQFPFWNSYILPLFANFFQIAANGTSNMIRWYRPILESTLSMIPRNTAQASGWAATDFVTDLSSIPLSGWGQSSGPGDAISLLPGNSRKMYFK